MFVRRFPIIFSVAFLVLLGMTGCTTPTESQTNSVGNATSSVTSSPEVTVSASKEGITQATNDTVAPGESVAGAATDQVESEPQAGGEMQPGALVAYSDSTYKFGITYPENFVVGALSAEKLAQLTPSPEAAVTFMNPETAASDLGDAEPADLEIRVYRAGDELSLDSWLMSNGLVPADGSVPLIPFHTASADGVRVCASTMVAPGCAYFVMGNGFIYQLTPASIEGESMAQTFVFPS